MLRVFPSFCTSTAHAVYFSYIVILWSKTILTNDLNTIFKSMNNLVIQTGCSTAGQDILVDEKYSGVTGSCRSANNNMTY